MSEYGIAAFRSRQQVMHFEETLRRAGLNVRVVSTPREVAVGCGLSVQFSMSDVSYVQNALNHARPSNLIGLYAVSQNGGERPRIKVISKQG